MAAFDAQKTLELELASVLQALARPPVVRHAHASRCAEQRKMVPGAGASALSLKRGLKRFCILALARRGAAGPRAPRLQLRNVGIREGGPGAAGGCPGQRGGT